MLFLQEEVMLFLYTTAKQMPWRAGGVGGDTHTSARPGPERSRLASGMAWPTWVPIATAPGRPPPSALALASDRTWPSGFWGGSSAGSAGDAATMPMRPGNAGDVDDEAKLRGAG
ncbi:hypothetical protein TSOC_008063 [Tetrabaena socialis]|uniref:Uncharacterized protein n=1 Tax=Tetrabaena socialis TaxID=47790 RepID=A0A2J7ZZJ0_9CHLO|nr:hypothetical protein TSOC_008063 [Tetrabaena socialis]|eukprot:PNH05658.1 hypothetical protein TSOC_008063 [Tetrabaena socialis]